MGQFGFFDADKRLAAISAKGDPLEMIARVVPFESFRSEIEAAVLTPASEKKSGAGRKPANQLRRDNSRIKTNKFAVAAYVRLWPIAEMAVARVGGRLSRYCWRIATNV